MSDIHIRRTHGLTLKKARTAAEKVAAHLQKEFELDWEWNANSLHFNRPGVTGQLNVSKHEVEVLVRLGFLLLPLRHRIEKEIHVFCDKQFGKDSGGQV